MKRDRNGGFTIMELAIVVAIFMVMILLLMPFVRMTRTWADRVNCANNLRRLSLGLQAYAAGHSGAFPARLGELYPSYVTNLKAFDCPASKHIGAPADPDYGYTAALTKHSSGGEIVAQDKDANHGRSGRNVIRINGSVDWVASN